MPEDILVLLAHDHAVHMCSLRMILEKPAARIFEAATLSEVARQLNSAKPPHVIFTDTFLVDAPWSDVLSIAARASVPMDVIVAPRLTDMDLYLEALESGAFDFLTPPWAEKDVAHVFRSAVEHVLARRKDPEEAMQPA